DAAAVGHLREALALWAGQPLSDAGGAFVGAARAQLVERRLAAVEDLADAELRLGRAGTVVADLTPEVEAHPLRGARRARLLPALCQRGGGAEAWQGYRGSRAGLAEERGLDPGREIVELERALLRGDLAPPSPPPAPPPPPSLPPSSAAPSPAAA